MLLYRLHILSNNAKYTMLLENYNHSVSGIVWRQETSPAVFDESMTLTCDVPGKTNKILFWHRGPSDLLSIGNSTVDSDQYRITMTYTENTTKYSLTILHLEMSDLGRWYRCSDSLDNSYEQYLNLSADKFICMFII